jgi:polyhydroxyalkanoate synthesis regulator phasin
MGNGNVLHEVMASGHSWAAERAQMALQVSEAVQNGQMSSDEAKEILADLISTDKLDQEATDQQVRAALVFGVSQLASFV